MPKSLSRAQLSGRILSPGLIQHGSGDVTWNLTAWESFDTPFPEIDEANTASDIIALVSGYIQSDNAVVGESNPISAGISLSDSSVASDSPSTVFVVVVSDNATANEAESISGVRAQSDGNTISETNSVNATVTGIDSSAQSDSANASVLIAVSDTASESEGLNLIGSPAIADSGTVSETRLNSGSISNADNTVESETELLTGGRLQADSAGENETVNQSAIVTANDSSAISDSESINGNFSGAPDASSASELRLLAAGILINDANNSIEAFSGSASMVQADTCLANDTSFNSTKLTASDQAIGAESNSYQGNTNRSDLSNSGEGLS